MGTVFRKRMIQALQCLSRAEIFVAELVGRGLVTAAGVALFFWGANGDHKYYKGAGSPGFGVEGEQDSAGVFMLLGLIVIFLGVSSLAAFVWRLAKKRHSDAENKQ